MLLCAMGFVPAHTGNHTVHWKAHMIKTYNGSKSGIQYDLLHFIWFTWA